MKQIPRTSIQCTKSTLNSGVDAPFPISNFPSTDLKEGVQVGRQTFVAFRPSHLSSGSEVKTARVPNKLDPEATD